MTKIKVKGQTVQTGERPQTNGRTHTHTHTHGRYRTYSYYLPLYAVDNYNKKHLKNCWAHSPLRAAVTLPFTRCRYCRTSAIAIAQAACDVHDDDDNNNNDYA